MSDDDDIIEIPETDPLEGCGDDSIGAEESGGGGGSGGGGKEGNSSHSPTPLPMPKCVPVPTPVSTPTTTIVQQIPSSQAPLPTTITGNQPLFQIPDDAFLIEAPSFIVP